ncbi:MAG: DUF4331 domain-containing protein [Phycisphaerales bacterium]
MLLNRATLARASTGVTAAASMIALAGVAAMITPASHASSHSDAPLIDQDPMANLTDVYAFVGVKYDDPSVEVLNIVANVRPFVEPGDGPHYERFADDARYSLHVADPMTGQTLVRYDFTFSDVDGGLKNPDTILSYGLGTEPGAIMEIGDARQNFTQTYAVERVDDGGSTVLVSDAVTGPPNPGNRVTPLYNDADGAALSGAGSFDELDAYTQQAITDGTGGTVFFAGTRDDSFFADVPGVFDLLNPRILDRDGDLGDGLGQDGNGVDGFKGFNVLTLAVQIPLDALPQLPYTDAFFGDQQGVGVYASVARRQFTERVAGDDIRSSGPWVQVNRLGNPLFNEVLVALADKDRFNATDPIDDAQFASYAENPEVASLINLVYGTEFATEGRADLLAVFIPDVIRVATTTGPVRLEGDDGFSRLGFIGGDLTADVDGVSSGWPNGRRFGDDVVDIALTAVASGPSYGEITLVGDNVTENDLPYHAVFPYAATPHAGTNNSKDRTPTDFDLADIDGDGAITIFDVLEFFNIWERAGAFR